MPSLFSIRKATPDDLPAIVDLCRAHATFERADSVPAARPSDLASVLFGDAPPLHALVAERAGALVGYATYTIQWSTWDAAPYVYLDCLYLRPEARGQGLGTHLVERVIEAARTHGCSHVQWQTPTFNTRAIAFYERLGAVGRSKVRFVLDVDEPTPGAASASSN